MIAEQRFSRGLKGNNIAAIIADLRGSAAVFPLDHRFRAASALVIGNFAMQINTADWLELAVSELDIALADDPTSVEMLTMVIAFDLALGRRDAAQARYAMFDLIARAALTDYLAIQKANITRKTGRPVP